MNIKHFTIVILLLITGNFYGQHKPNKEKIKSLKVAYITEKLDLTSKEAQDFWPIYNKHEEQLETLRYRERTEVFSKLRNVEQLSENEVNKLLELHISLKEERNKIEKKFISDIRKVISAKKTFVLIQTENGFKRKLIKQYRQKHPPRN